MTTDNAEWIPAAEALDFVMAATQSRYLAVEALCTRALDGLVRARAVRLVIHGKVQDQAEVPKEFWWAKGRAALLQNWAVGDFETWRAKVQLRAFGVTFHRGDVEAMVPARSRPAPVGDSPTGSASEDARNTGGRPFSVKWRNWVAELVLYVHENGVPPGVGNQGQDEMISAIAERLTRRGEEEPLSRTTVQPVVKAVLERLRSP